MWTTHGHQILGTIAQDPIASDRPKVARCGGPGICGTCTQESAKAQKEAGTDEFGMPIEKDGT